jgi:hypothetical protein
VLAFGKQCPKVTQGCKVWVPIGASLKASPLLENPRMPPGHPPIVSMDGPWPPSVHSGLCTQQSLGGTLSPLFPTRLFILSMLG